MEVMGKPTSTVVDRTHRNPIAAPTQERIVPPPNNCRPGMARNVAHAMWNSNGTDAKAARFDPYCFERYSVSKSSGRGADFEWRPLYCGVGL